MDSLPAQLAKAHAKQEWVKLSKVLVGLQGNVGYVWIGRRAGTTRWRRDFVETLRTLVDTWLAQGRNFARWQEQHHDLARSVRHVARTFRPVFHVPPTSPPIWLTDRRLPARLSDRASYEATCLFLELVTSWRAPDLGKCPCCEKYFLNTSGHAEKVYCSRKCALTASAQRSTEKRRKDAHEAKVRTAAALISEYQAHHRREDWKTWIAGKQNITRHWLTRALNKGWLKPPAQTGGN